MFRNVLLVLSLVLLASTAQAQFATAPLDPTLENRLPQAASWRYVKGQNEQDDMRTATLAYVTKNGSGENDAGDLTWKTSGKNFLLIAKTENVSIEAFNQTSKKTTIEFGNSGYACTRVDELDQCGMGQITQDVAETRLGFGLKEGDASYGASYRTKELGWDSYNPIKRTAIGLGGTWKLGKVFFVALGLEQVSEDQPYLNPDLKWTNSIWGLGLMSGNPEETQLRLEVGGISSSEQTAEENGYESIHQAQNESLLTAEVKMNGILLHYREEGVKYAEVSNYSGWGDQATSRTSIGVGWAPNNGFIFSVQAITEVYEMANSTFDQEAKILRMALGYNF